MIKHDPCQSLSGSLSHARCESNHWSELHQFYQFNRIKDCLQNGSVYSGIKWVQYGEKDMSTSAAFKIITCMHVRNKVDLVSLACENVRNKLVSSACEDCRNRMLSKKKIIIMNNTLVLFISFFFLLVYTVELQWLEHRWLVYHGCFELVLESLGKNPTSADIIVFGIIKCDFLFFI